MFLDRRWDGEGGGILCKEAGYRIGSAPTSGEREQRAARWCH